jgi:hypothetical protein
VVPLKLGAENKDPNASKSNDNDDISVKKRQKPQLSEMDRAVATYLQAQDGPSSSMSQDINSFCRSVGIFNLDQTL